MSAGHIFKKIGIVFLITLGLLYIFSGIYFYQKSFRKKYVPGSNDADTSFSFNEADLVVMKELMVDFEDEGIENRYPVSSEFSYSGKKSVKITPEMEYAAEIRQSFSELPSPELLRQVEVTVMVRNSSMREPTLWILEVNGEDNKMLDWHPEDLPSSLNKWESYTFRFNINPAFLKNFNRIKTYAWNRNKNTSYIDDVRIRFLGLPKKYNSNYLTELNQSSFSFDLESDSSLENTEALTEEIAHSGKRASYLSGKSDYSVSVYKRLGEVINDTIKTVTASVWIYPVKTKPECTLVIEVRNTDEEQIYWNGKSTAAMNLSEGKWNKLNAGFNIPPEDYRKFSDDDIIYVYVLNNSRSALYVDDFEISYEATPANKGSQVFVDMNSFDEHSYVFNRYHPPYPVSNLQWTELNNENSVFLVKSDTLHYGELLPDQFIATGNFSGRSAGRDELLSISKSSVDIFHFCERMERFIIAGSATLNVDLPGKTTYLTGDFNGDGRCDLLASNGKAFVLYDFSFSNYKDCADSKSELKMNTLWRGALPAIESKLYSGRFSGTACDELFQIDSSGLCLIKKFDGKSWSVLATNTVSKEAFRKNSTQVCGSFISKDKDVLLSIYSNKNRTEALVLRYQKGTIGEVALKGQDIIESVFSPDDKLYRVSSSGNSLDKIFAYNNRWRNEMRIIESDEKGFFISSVPEFRGYAYDQNPKYYEFIKLIPGKFKGGKVNLLCMLRNCADSDFNGRHCKKYESLSDLPNKIELYNFSE